MIELANTEEFDFMRQDPRFKSLLQAHRVGKVNSGEMAALFIEKPLGESEQFRQSRFVKMA
jgi:hypothetical protein